MSGKLLPEAGGKPRWPPVPEEILRAQPAILEAIEGHDDGRMQNWYAEPVEKTDVRSVYLVVKRAVSVPLLLPFDLPDTTVSCACRNATVVAPQALTLLNNHDAVRLSRALAARVAAAAGDDPGKQVEAAFRLALARKPDADERALALDLLRRHAERYRAAKSDTPPGRRALADLCRALVNLNEFAYVD